jgi:mercuric ion binding protein
MDPASPPFVKASVQTVPGVVSVAVSYKDRAATMTYDGADADLNQPTSATTNAGYPSEPKS